MNQIEDVSNAIAALCPDGTLGERVTVAMCWTGQLRSIEVSPIAKSRLKMTVDPHLWTPASPDLRLIGGPVDEKPDWVGERLELVTVDGRRHAFCREW